MLIPEHKSHPWGLYRKCCVNIMTNNIAVFNTNVNMTIKNL